LKIKSPNNIETIETYKRPVALCVAWSLIDLKAKKFMIKGNIIPIKSPTNIKNPSNFTKNDHKLYFSQYSSI